MAKSMDEDAISLEEMNKVLQSDNDILRSEMKQIKEQLEHEKSQNMKLERENDKLESEKNQALERLSEEWNAKVGADEKNLENVNIKNRPQTVAERYQNLCSNTWLNAKGSLDKIATDMPEDDKFKLLVDCLVTGEIVAKDKYLQVTSIIFEMISVHVESGTREYNKEVKCIKAVTPTTEPAKALTTTKYAAVCDSMPLSLRNAIGDFLRRTCDSTDISAITNEIKENLQERFYSLVQQKVSEDTEEYRNAMAYLEECGRVAWIMVAQRPPMTFDKDTGVGEKYEDKNLQELYYRSDDPNDPDAIVKLYIHPALKHDKSIMVKGRVLVAKK